MTFMKLKMASLAAASVLALAGCSQAEAPAPAAPAAPAVATPVAPAAVPSLASNAIINPNTASEAILAAVPGLGSDQINALLSARPFATQSAFDAALNLPDEAKAAIYKVMFVKIGLNSAAAEDIMLVPSVLSPRKLAHEIDEYRPYASLEEFRAELGKYMDAPALADLERYVTLD